MGGGAWYVKTAVLPQRAAKLTEKYLHVIPYPYPCHVKFSQYFGSLGEFAAMSISRQWLGPVLVTTLWKYNHN